MLDDYASRRDFGATPEPSGPRVRSRVERAVPGLIS